MPYPTEHTARVKDPGEFEPESFRRKPIAAGVDLVFGRPLGSEYVVAQSYRFDAGEFTTAEAKAWLDEHGVAVLAIEPAAVTKESRALAETLEGLRSQHATATAEAASLRAQVATLTHAVDEATAAVGRIAGGAS